MTGGPRVPVRFGFHVSENGKSFVTAIIGDCALRLLCTGEAASKH